MRLLFKDSKNVTPSSPPSSFLSFSFILCEKRCRILSTSFVKNQNEQIAYIYVKKLYSRGFFSLRGEFVVKINSIKFNWRKRLWCRGLLSGACEMICLVSWKYIYATVSTAALIHGPKSSNGHPCCNSATWSCCSAISLKSSLIISREIARSGNRADLY